MLKDPLTAIWFFSAIILLIVLFSLLAYLILTILKEKRKKVLEKSSGERKKKKEEEKKKTYLDELLFVIGLFGFIIGYLRRNWWLLIIGTIIMFLSLYLLHYLLIPRSIKKIKLKKEKKKKEEVIKSISVGSKKQIIKQKSDVTFKTDLDTIYDLVMEKRSIKLKEVAYKLKLSLIKVEEYAKILDEQNLISFFFPVFGSPVLREKNNNNEVKVIKKHKKKKKIILFIVIIVTILVILYFILRRYGYIY